MSEILAVYGTHHGQTREIVQRLGRVISSHQHHVTTWRGDLLPEDYSLEGFDGFLLAGSVHFGRHQRYLRDFVRRHAPELNRSRTAFVSVCGALGGGWAQGPAEARRYVERFCSQTGLAPSVSRSVAGAIRYTQYGWPLKLIIRLISARTGRPTDTSRDWDFTDWDAVDELGRELADRLAGSSAALAAEPAGR